jgi:hypothetical protein
LRIYQTLLGEDGLVEFEEICHVDEAEYARRLEDGRIQGLTIEEMSDLDDLGHSPITGLWFDGGPVSLF